jgi:glutathione peroxidase
LNTKAKSRAVGLSLLGVAAFAATAQATAPPSLYAMHTKTLDGKPVSLAKYKGKVTLVVNVASKCGFTPQYTGLEKLYKDLQPKGFVILGFPCNDFGGQEPGTPEEIAQFCSSKYEVTFPLFEKVSVKPGPGQSPIYQYLTASGNVPPWNFSKYLIDRQGHIVKFFPSSVKPDAPELRQAIETTLASKS